MASQKIDIIFPVTGDTAPADNNYAMFSAICKQIPDIRDNDVAIMGVNGVNDGNGKIFLVPYSKSTIRVDAKVIPLVYKLANTRLLLGKHRVNLGTPKMRSLEPANLLRSRIVTIKGFQEPKPMIEAVNRQLQALGIKDASITIPQNGRKTVRIKETTVGFTTLIGNLSDEESLLLQDKGVGGRRRMGCGFFLPAKPTIQDETETPNV